MLRCRASVGVSSDGAAEAHRGNAVAWRTARRAAGAAATRRGICERCDAQQDSPNAPGGGRRAMNGSQFVLAERAGVKRDHARLRRPTAGGGAGVKGPECA